MHLARDRHVVADVEDVGVEAAVPAHDVEGVLGHRVDRAGDAARAAPAVLDVHVDVLLVDEQRLRRTAQVALAVGRVLEQLAVAGEVALRRGDVAARLDRVETRGLALAQHPPVDRRAGDDRVVALGDLERAELRLEQRGSALDVDALVTDGVLVQRGREPDVGVGDAHVTVAEDEPTTGHRVRPGSLLVGEEVVEPEVPGEQRLVGRERLVGQLPRSRPDDARRDVPVVEQRAVGAEALLAHELLGEDAAVGVLEEGVPLVRHGSDLAVVGHGLSFTSLCGERIRVCAQRTA